MNGCAFSFLSLPSPCQMMDYNVPLGKLNRGMAVLDVVRCAWC